MQAQAPSPMMTPKKLVFALIGMVLVSLLLSLPSVRIQPGVDKLVHALLFFGYFMLLIQWMDSYTRRQSPARRMIVIGGLLILIGGLYEKMQDWFIPTRNYDLADWLADSLGVMAGALYYWLLNVRKLGGGG
jgi:VanZ family protein